MGLSKAMAELARNRKKEIHTVDDRPGCAFGLVTRRALEDLAKDFDRLENKINGVIFGVVLTFMVELWKTFRQ
ncbi:MAG: hypothetical protein HY675_02790 [Chloroflexi bacterium]|nr:hypothetical protein [Chloroflexota bacterium]